MPSRKFVYKRDGVVEITGEAEKAQCDEISADVASRSEPMDFSGSGYTRAAPGTWPRVSESHAVHPSQIQEAQEYLAKKGVYTEFEQHTGRAVFRDKAHKRAHLRAINACDPDASYGDAAPLNITEDRWKQLRRF